LTADQIGTEMEFKGRGGTRRQKGGDPHGMKKPLGGKPQKGLRKGQKIKRGKREPDHKTGSNLRGKKLNPSEKKDLSGKSRGNQVEETLMKTSAGRKKRWVSTKKKKKRTCEQEKPQAIWVGTKKGVVERWEKNHKKTKRIR